MAPQTDEEITFEPFEGAYNEDPRIGGINDGVILLSDGDGEWQVSRVSAQPGQVGGLWWVAFDPNGTFCADFKDTAEEAIFAVIGAPLWYLMAELLVAGLNNSGFVEVAEEEPAGRDLAATNLVNSGFVVAETSGSGKVWGYVLTQAGVDLADDLAQCQEPAEGHELIVARVEQHA